MAKTKVSASELVWIFTERLRSFRDCPPAASVAIVPTGRGWRAITSRKDMVGYPNCTRRVEKLQQQLRELYILTSD